MNKDLLSIKDLSVTQIHQILNTAEHFLDVNQRQIKKVPTLRGRTVVLAFFENSTRTKHSFELAAKRLSADIISFSSSTSSTNKGETLLDTARNLDAMFPDLMVIRHSQSGAPHLLSKHFSWSVLNAGDGINEHPSQALLDMLTLRQRLGSIKGKTVAIVGDIYHSRVARSNIFALTKMGARVLVAGPGTMCSPLLTAMGVEVRHGIDDLIEEVDAIMMLRIQRERLAPGMLPSVIEYSEHFGLNQKRLERLKDTAIVLHPGPINRGVELTSEVAASSRSAILEQVSNGIAVRMAIMYLIMGGQPLEQLNG